jgi:hypothetical protein
MKEITERGHQLLSEFAAQNAVPDGASHADVQPWVGVNGGRGAAGGGGLPVSGGPGGVAGEFAASGGDGDSADCGRGVWAMGGPIVDRMQAQVTVERTM